MGARRRRLHPPPARAEAGRGHYAARTWTGAGLALRIRARGGRIEACVGGARSPDVTDTHHTRGRIGLNVSGGRAACQDTFVTAL
ncbi:hypothetical protein ACGF8B_31970 [Streptomyces sp. NPDC047917]|uniref:hypothetical protein n=1 Tax=Streptomyces sp. NPDC047917 TaxID=3365491 RepID=UPI0037127F75